MNIKCPKCNQEYEVDESMTGQTVECENCHEQWVIDNTSLNTKPCPICGESILAVAKKCRFCGEYLSEDARPKPRKDRNLYILFGLFLGGWGVHNFYAGQIAAGIVKLLFFAIGIVAVASCSPHEAARVWIAPALFNLYFVIWDLCYDPNTPTKDRNKIYGISPWLMSILVLIAVFFVIFVIVTMLDK